MRTVGQIVAAAYAVSKRAQVDVDATPAELANVLNSAMRRYFTAGTSLNPHAFLKEDTLKTQGDAWKRPDDAEYVWQLKRADKPMTIVPFDNQDADPKNYCVYRVGNLYKPVARPPNLTPEIRDNIRVYYARQPDVLNVTWEKSKLFNAAIDVLFPQGHEQLLSLELGLFLARKDGRDKDVAALMPWREEERGRFLESLRRADLITSSRGVARAVSTGPVLLK